MQVTYGNGTATDLAYDNASRLTALTQDLSGTADDNTATFQYNKAGQISELTRSNDAYAWTGHAAKDVADTHNGLNQVTASGSVTVFAYDARGNLTSDGTSGYTYSSENFLKTAPGGFTLDYDPLGRLAETDDGSAVTRLAYDGADLIAEYDVSGNILRRYVHGPGTDDPVLWYEGSGTSDKRYLHKDERGSVIAVSDGAGDLIALGSYDEYGIPAAANTGRFQYTGQTWIEGLDLYYYKARFYDPELGRFLQSDPIGYGDGMNMYGYVGGDPVNVTDSTGLCGRICEHEIAEEKRLIRKWRAAIANENNVLTGLDKELRDRYGFAVDPEPIVVTAKIGDKRRVDVGDYIKRIYGPFDTPGVNLPSPRSIWDTLMPETGPAVRQKGICRHACKTF